MPDRLPVLTHAGCGRRRAWSTRRIRLLLGGAGRVDGHSRGDTVAKNRVTCGSTRSLRKKPSACIAHLRFPLRHRKVIRATNLLERLFLEERRRTKIHPARLRRAARAQVDAGVEVLEEPGHERRPLALI